MLQGKDGVNEEVGGISVYLAIMSEWRGCGQHLYSTAHTARYHSSTARTQFGPQCVHGTEKG